MRKKKKALKGIVGIAVLAMTCLPSGGGAVPETLRITEEGQPKAVIVKPAKASKVINFAADELRKYVGKMSGAALPVRETGIGNAEPVIMLETAKLDPPRKGLDCDSFTVKTSGSRVLLTGNTDRAVLYAVYAFLETLGAVWLEPGEAGEIVPRKPTLAVPEMNLAFKPAFDLRGMRIYDQGAGKETIDWMGKMRMNLVLHPVKDGGLEERGILLMYGTSHRVSQRMGLPETWFKNPENTNYVAMLNGKREIPKGPANAVKDSWTYDVDVCLANREGAGRLMAISLDFIAKNPATYLYDMRTDDKCNNWCECDACMKKTPTDDYVIFINQLARKIHEKWPCKKLSLIAYFDTMPPPKTVKPDLSMENLILWFAPISRPYRQPIDSPTAERPKLEFPRNKASWPATDGGWKPFLLAWRDVFQGPILVLDYYNWSGEGQAAAALRAGYFYTRPGVIAADLRYYQKLGLSGSIGVEPCPLKLPNVWNQYLKAKLLWDPSQDMAGLQRDFDQHFYGECADIARRCLVSVADTLNAELDTADSVQQVRRAAAGLAAGRSLCAASPAVRERLDRIALWAEYVALRKELFRHRHAKTPDARKKAAAELSAFLKANEAAIKPLYNEIPRMDVPWWALSKK
ncbi:MAG: DUF4838 domain-containing protein [Kiritimatiellae bacterium]|nr:DUF4838 domain-containing protein [Kiritimatiellia bacterium]